jgi:hypothetical protein
VIAHEFSIPASIRIAPLDNPVAGLGVDESVVVPSPN